MIWFHVLRCLSISYVKDHTVTVNQRHSLYKWVRDTLNRIGAALFNSLRNSGVRECIPQNFIN